MSQSARPSATRSCAARPVLRKVDDQIRDRIAICSVAWKAPPPAQASCCQPSPAVSNTYGAPCLTKSLLLVTCVSRPISNRIGIDHVLLMIDSEDFSPIDLYFHKSLVPEAQPKTVNSLVFPDNLRSIDAERRLFWAGWPAYAYHGLRCQFPLQVPDLVSPHSRIPL